MKPIPGWEGEYSITQDGRVWSHHIRRFRTTTPRKGYPWVNLKKNGVQHGFAVHRLVAAVFLGATPEQQIEHRDGNRKNCHFRNLRTSTQTQNRGNSRGWKNKRSGSRFKGVFPYGKKWKAQVGLGGRTTYLGVFEKERDAARAYDLKAVEIYGEFAKTNFSVEKQKTKE